MNEEDPMRQKLEINGTPWSVASILIAVCATVTVICGLASWIVVEMIRSN